MVQADASSAGVDPVAQALESCPGELGFGVEDLGTGGLARLEEEPPHPVGFLGRGEAALVQIDRG